MENLFLFVWVYLPVFSRGTFVFRKKASRAAKGACKKNGKNNGRLTNEISFCYWEFILFVENVPSSERKIVSFFCLRLLRRPGFCCKNTNLISLKLNVI